MKRGMLFLMSAFASTLFLNVVSAWGGGFYNPRPSDFFNSEWVRFAVVFIVFYALIFFTMKKVFKDGGKQTAVAISLGVSLLITAAAAQQGLLEGYVAEDISALLLLLGIFVFFGFIFRFFFKHSPVAAYFILSGLWLVMFLSDPARAIPYILQTDTILTIYEFIASPFGLLILIGIGAISSLNKRKIHLAYHP